MTPKITKNILKKNKIIPLKISQIEGLKNIIKNTIHKRGKDFQQEYNRRNLIYEFPNIVGESIAKRVKPIMISDYTLYLHVPDAVWRNEIKFSSDRIIAKLNEYAKFTLIKKIDFIKNYQIIKLTDEKAINITINKNIAEYIREKEIKKEIYKENISEEEIKKAKNKIAQLNNEKLQNTLLEAYIKNKKRQSWQFKNLTPCPLCNKNYINDEEKICFNCYHKAINKAKEEIKKYLIDIPWANNSEIKREIKNTYNYLINSVRMDLIKEQIAKINKENIKDKKNIEITTLIMLYKLAKINEITPELIDKSLYELKNDIKIKIN